MKFYYFLLIFVTALWGISYTAIKEFITEVPNEFFQMSRYLVALVFFVAVFFKELKGMKLSHYKDGLWKVGLMSFASSYFAALGLERVSASQTAFLSNLPIVITPLVLFIHTRAKINTIQWASVILCMGGILFLTSPWNGGFNIGSVYLLIAAVAYTYQFFGIKDYAMKHGAYKTAFMQFLYSFLGFFIVSLSKSQIRIYEDISIQYWMYSVVLSGIVFTGLAWFILAVVQKKLSVVTVSLFMTLEPLFTLVSEWLYKGNTLTLAQSIGAILVLFSLVICAIEPRIVKGSLTRKKGC